MKQTNIRPILVSTGTLTANSSNINGHEKTASPGQKELKKNITIVSKISEISDNVKVTTRKRIVRENSPRILRGKQKLR